MKHKQSKIIVVDKVAIVALPLILLLFLLIYARPKTWLNSSVDLPKGTFQVHNEADAELTVILKKGRYAVVIAPELRAPALKEIVHENRIGITYGQVDKFSQIDVFRPGLKGLPAYIDSVKVGKGRYDQPSDTLRKDTAKDLLKWMVAVHKQKVATSDQQVRVALLCDSLEPYPNIDLIRRTAREAGLSRIKLIYNAKRSIN